jgi:hypothetical protein
MINKITITLLLLCFGAQAQTSSNSEPFHIMLQWDAGETTNRMVLIVPEFGPKRTISAESSIVTVSNLYHTNAYTFVVTNEHGGEMLKWPPTIFQTNGVILIRLTLNGITNPVISIVPYWWSGSPDNHGIKDTPSKIPQWMPAGSNVFITTLPAVTNNAWRYHGAEQPD